MLTELFRDARLVIIDKPAGMPVHPGPSRTPSVEDLFPTLTRKKHGPWLAHRLDADTSGCLAIALSKTALLAAQSAFATGRAQKTYWAIVAGTPATPYGTIDAPLLKTTATGAGWRMIVSPRGDPAISDWHILGTTGAFSLLEIRPRTGRTHQVRVHCAAIGTPILHDPIYGPAPTPGTICLLARRLVLPLDPPAAATAPVPPHMQAILNAHPGLS